jgi:hypothetical protein
MCTQECVGRRRQGMEGHCSAGRWAGLQQGVWFTSAGVGASCGCRCLNRQTCCWCFAPGAMVCGAGKMCQGWDPLSRAAAVLAVCLRCGGCERLAGAGPPLPHRMSLVPPAGIMLGFGVCLELPEAASATWLQHGHGGLWGGVWYAQLRCRQSSSSGVLAACCAPPTAAASAPPACWA